VRCARGTASGDVTLMNDARSLNDRESDSAALIELRRLLFRETSNMLWEADEFTQTAEGESKRIARLNGRLNGLVLLAEDSGVPVGVLTAAGGEVRRLRHSATLVLGVAKSHWGQGVASAMITEAKGWAWLAGLHRLADCPHHQLAGFGVYLRAGFQVEWLRRASLLVDGQYVDALSIRAPLALAGEAPGLTRPTDPAIQSTFVFGRRVRPAAPRAQLHSALCCGTFELSRPWR
jgi:RimJ/RimL family protein N-acetyltransferase